MAKAKKEFFTSAKHQAQYQSYLSYKSFEKLLKILENKGFSEAFISGLYNREKDNYSTKKDLLTEADLKDIKGSVDFMAESRYQVEFASKAPKKKNRTNNNHRPEI